MSAIGNGISQATEATQGVISAEGKIGKNKASGSIDSEGIWDLGIDFKVGGLGITNDYGGAITISIAGQSITWGREGGKIHYNLGGFEVIVEARDCVVTETKVIMGIEVASHTYPDPGCKLPEPEPKPLIPNPNPEPSDPVGVEVPDTDVDGWVFLDIVGMSHWVDGTFLHSAIRREIKSPIKERLPYVGRAPMDMTSTASRIAPPPSRTFEEVQIKKNGDRLWVHQIPLYDPIPYRNSAGFYENREIGRQNAASLYFTGDNTPLFFWGKFKDIKRFIALSEENNAQRVALYPGTYDITKYIPFACIPYRGEVEEEAPQPFLQPGVPPHMNNDCCEEILDSLDDLKDVLHVDFFKKSKFPIPSYLLAPGVDPSKVTMANNYYNLFQKLFQALAHSTIISPKIDIQDADAVKPGDQPVNSEYLSATGWAEAITKMLYEIVDDGNVATNMDIRTGVTVTQLLVAVADLSHKVDCIIDCIGVTTKRTKGEVETSYNLVVEESDSKGFDPKKANQKLDLNSDISTEQLLSSLLRTRKNPIVKEEIHPKSPTLFELLQDLKQKE